MGGSSNLIPVAKTGKPGNKHTNQPKPKWFHDSVILDARWNAVDGGDENSSTEQR